MSVLTPLAPEIWTVSRPLRFFGLALGTRMTVVRLSGGGLFVHSPVALDAETRAAVDAEGPVAVVVAPCLFHHLHIGAWAEAYPDATIIGCPGLAAKRPDVRWSRAVDPSAPDDAAWSKDLDAVVFTAVAMQNEVVFHHRASATMISSDVIFNLATHESAFTRVVGRMIASREPAPSFLERLLIKDRAAAREQIGRMVAWGPERIVLAHGDNVLTDGAGVLERGYAWLA